MVTLLGLFFFRLEHLQAVRIRAEDSLTAAALAGAVIDLEIYEEEEAAVITDVNDAYRSFCKALRSNLHLDEEWNPQDESLISSSVKVERYWIYNVFDEDVEQYQIYPDGSFIKYSFPGAKGKVYTPDGKRVDYTTIHCSISFEVEGLKGYRRMVNKACSVDVVAEPQEDENEKKEENL